MDDLSAKLSEILSDPESMSRVREMAESILSEKPQPEPQKPDFSALADIGEISQIMGLVSKLQSSNDDPRAALLSALKPHLSEAKREKVDTAIKILRLLDLLPLIKESGILGKLL